MVEMPGSRRAEEEEERHLGTKEVVSLTPPLPLSLRRTFIGTATRVVFVPPVQGLPRDTQGGQLDRQ